MQDSRTFCLLASRRAQEGRAHRRKRWGTLDGNRIAAHSVRVAKPQTERVNPSLLTINCHSLDPLPLPLTAVIEAASDLPNLARVTSRFSQPSHQHQPRTQNDVASHSWSCDPDYISHLAESKLCSTTITWVKNRIIATPRARRPSPSPSPPSPAPSGLSPSLARTLPTPSSHLMRRRMRRTTLLQQETRRDGTRARRSHKPCSRSSAKIHIT